MIARYHDLPEAFHAAAAEPGAVLLHTARPDRVERTSWLYRTPLEVLTLDDAADARSFLRELDRRVDDGYRIAGYLAYEAGYPLVGVAGPPASDGPLGWFGVYASVATFDHVAGLAVWDGGGGGAAAQPGEAPSGAEVPSSADGLASVEGGEDAALASFDGFGLDWPTYRERLERVHELLAAGDTYQVNFADRFEGRARDLLGLFRRLVRTHPVPYAAFVNCGDRQVASLSPELFFRAENRSLLARPMKGTAPRGRDAREDAAIADALRRDEKSRAENVMIVDLLRNDLGRVCEHGTVRVPALFDVERYRTVQQMTSTVTGRMRADVRLSDLFGALFPCGSVTGAPKRRTMEIIRDLERAPRAVYTGAIGHAAKREERGAPPRAEAAGATALQATFSVAIRTLVSQRSEPGRGSVSGGLAQVGAGRLTLGVGGGIVADSEPEREYRECLLKARFATDPGEPFELIETLRYDGGFRLLDAHLARLRASAGYFGFAIDVNALRDDLAALADGLRTGGVVRVGVRLPPSGEHRLRAEPLSTLRSSGRTEGDRYATAGAVGLADDRVDSRDPFLRHKTTRRALHRRWHDRAARLGLADHLLTNERGELTEGTISNVFLDIGGELLTPPVEAGLLPGVWRAHVLRTNRRAREARLVPADLWRAERIFVCNALRGMREVRLVETLEGAPASGRG